MSRNPGRTLSAHPDETVIARPTCCARCQAAFAAADHKLIDRFDKIELPTVTPAATRVELYAGQCQACGATTVAPLPAGLEQGSPFSINIVALALSSHWRCICASPTPSATGG
jgi:transposase